MPTLMPCGEPICGLGEEPTQTSQWMDSGQSALSSCIVCGDQAQPEGRLCYICRGQIVGAVGLLNRNVRLVKGGRPCLGKVVNVEGDKCLVMMRGSVYDSQEIYDSRYLEPIDEE